MCFVSECGTFYVLKRVREHYSSACATFCSLNHFIIMFHGTRKDTICMSTLDVSRVRVNCNYIVSFVFFSHAVRATSVLFYFFFHFRSRENSSLVRATLKLRGEMEWNVIVMHFSDVFSKRILIAFRLFTYTMYLTFD